jgi:hypothetical protein
VRFHLEQQLDGSPHDVAAAFADPDCYATLVALPKLGPPEVLDVATDGTVVRLRIRYRFTGELSTAARAVLDPSRLSWVEESRHDLDALEATFRMIADHHRDRFTCDGQYRFTATGGGTRRIAAGNVAVRTPLVGRRVEQAIVSGLEEHLRDEAPFVEAFLHRRGSGPSTG